MNQNITKAQAKPTLNEVSKLYFLQADSILIARRRLCLRRSAIKIYIECHFCFQYRIFSDKSEYHQSVGKAYA